MKKLLLLGMIFYSNSIISVRFSDLGEIKPDFSAYDCYPPSSLQQVLVESIIQHPVDLSVSVGFLSAVLYKKYAPTKNENKSLFYSSQNDAQVIRFGLGLSKFLVELQKDNFEIDIQESPRSKKYTYLSEKNKNTIIVGSLMTAFTYGLISYIGKK